MKPLLPALALVLVSGLPAHAQMYKCTDGDKVAYSEAPCERGTQTEMRVPEAPAPDPAAAGDLQRMRRQSEQLQKERLAREARQERADALHDRHAAQRRDQCAKLELARKWAEDDVRRASHGAIDSARLKARRATERHAAACK